MDISDAHQNEHIALPNTFIHSLWLAKVRLGNVFFEEEKNRPLNALSQNTYFWFVFDTL